MEGNLDPPKLMEKSAEPICWQVYIFLLSLSLDHPGVTGLKTYVASKSRPFFGVQTFSLEPRDHSRRVSRRRQWNQVGPAALNKHACGNPCLDTGGILNSVSGAK